jgi:hypothetical protein
MAGKPLTTASETYWPVTPVLSRVVTVQVPEPSTALFRANVEQCIRAGGGSKIRFSVDGSSASCADTLLLD